MLLTTSSARRVLLALGASSLVLGSAVHVQAADEGGLGGLFQQLFSPQPTPAPQPTPTPAPQSAYGQADGSYGSRRSGYSYGYSRREWRQSARRQRLKDPQAQVKPKVRYTSLPKPEKVTAASDKAPQRSAGSPEVWKYAGNPDAALMHDSTLRKGDIVITTAGPKVFTGKTGEKHAAGEFEPVSRSPVDRKTCKLLAAMVAPPGALPAEEARKLMAKLPRSSGQSSAPAAPQVQSAALRVVYPSGQQGSAIKVSLQGN